MEKLLKRDPHISVTERLVTAVLGNELCGKEVLHLLLSRTRNTKVTESALVATSFSGHDGLFHRLQEFKIPNF